MSRGMELTKPLEVGKTYKRVDGKEVTCIKVTDLRGYECAQFDDYAETHARTMKDWEGNESALDYIKRFGGDDPETSGYRYNRASDRGRCTGGKLDNFAVIPEPLDADYAIPYMKHLLRSFEGLL